MAIAISILSPTTSSTTHPCKQRFKKKKPLIITHQKPSSSSSSSSLPLQLQEERNTTHSTNPIKNNQKQRLTSFFFLSQTIPYHTMTPFSPPHNHFSHPKPLTNTNTNNNNNNNNSTTTATHPQQFCYEPTSVLELRGSPSPVLGGGSANLFTGLSDNNTHINWDDQNHILHHTNNHHQIPPPIDDDWDSMMLGLEEEHHHDDHEDSSSEKDDSTFPFKYSPPPQFTTTFDEQPHSHNNIIPSPTIILNQNNLEFDCSQLEQLIRAAASVESNDLHLAQVILARLNQTALISPTGKPLQRAAFYFKEALQLLLSGSCSSPDSHHLSNSEIVHKIKAYKSFSEISPITMFANFTANQAFLEALEGSMFIHIIDFEIGLGGHWASFMQELASKRKSRNHNTSHSSLRITAVIVEEASVGGEAKLIRENLQHFAQQLGIHFHLEFLLFNSFQLLLFNAIRFINGEVVALNLSPSVFHNLRTSDSIAAFLRFLPRISPRITVFVDQDGCSRDFVATPSSSFRRNFVTGLEFYSSLLESLDGANSGDRELIPRIETLLLRPKIAGMVAAAAANCILPCREMLSSVGMVPVRFSEFTDTQAEWLVRRAQVRGFHVVKRQGVMLLCWHERELVATSAWRVS